MEKTEQTNKDASGPAVKRAYRLTQSGLESLRASAAKNRPWEKSTGPKTVRGKGVSCMNAFKHGERSAFAMSHRTMFQTLKEFAHC
tara:strand:- start:437 stop:694 length:258 start_codon:yes stop_codon:yes gene_type:complete